MGVEPFLLSSTLLVALAQRLVRRLCPDCKRPHTATEAECRILQVPVDQAPTLYTAAGCPKCNGTGYIGRSGIYELVIVDDTLRNLIHEGAGEHELELNWHTPLMAAESVALAIAGPGSDREIEGPAEVGPGWRSRRYGERESIRTVQRRFKGELPCEWKTTVVWAGQSDLEDWAGEVAAFKELV